MQFDPNAMDAGQYLSNSAIRKAVLAQSLQHPSVVYPAALGMLGGIGAVTIAGSPVLIGAAAVAGGAALVALLTNYFGRYDRIAASYLVTLRQRLSARREAQVSELSEDLKEVGAEDGARQLDRFVEKMDAFQAVLGERLSPGELTFARFSAIAEAVFLAGVDNLRSVHLMRRTLQGIDVDYISHRLRALGNSTGASGADSEVQGLKSQLDQATLLEERVKGRLGQNELAMAELDRASSAIGEMKTGTDRPTLDMEAAMQELTRIAKRSTEY